MEEYEPLDPMTSGCCNGWKEGLPEDGSVISARDPYSKFLPDVR
jgi:hypothetical protein